MKTTSEQRAEWAAIAENADDDMLAFAVVALLEDLEEATAACLKYELATQKNAEAVRINAAEITRLEAELAALSAKEST